MKAFKSKVGYELLIPVLFILILVYCLPIITGDYTGSKLTLTLIMVPCIAFVLHLFLMTSYRINEKDELVIKCGIVFNSKVNIHKITSARETRNPISSPAPSLDRIELKVGDAKRVIISPKDKIGFINELLKINPNIDNQIRPNN